MKIAGIMGGMGPGTTADFYGDINALAESRGVENRPEVIVWNVPLDYTVEQELLTHQTGIEKYKPYLVDTAKKLEAAGADFIAVPCNTVHELYDDFADAVTVPVLHIVGETVSELKRRDIGAVTLLATGQTIGSSLYQSFLSDAYIDCRIPAQTEQDRLDAIVASLVTAEGAASGKDSEDAEWLGKLVDRALEETGTVVLGCTDFHIMLDEKDPKFVIDSMHALARATVDKMYEV